MVLPTPAAPATVQIASVGAQNASPTLLNRGVASGMLVVFPLDETRRTYAPPGKQMMVPSEAMSPNVHPKVAGRAVI